MHFLLWRKGSHQSPNFDTSKCSGEILSYSSCHFPNHKSIFLQILHDSSVSWKITTLYISKLNVLYFAWKGLIEVQIFEILSARIKIHQILVIFERTNWFFFKFCITLSVLWDITPLYFFSWIFIYFQQKEPIKVQIWWNFTWAVESLKFCTLMGSFCPNHIKFQLKVISHDT